MSKWIDYFKLYAIKNGRHIFLREKFDKQFSLLLKIGRVYRRTLISRTKLVVVVGSLGKTTTTRAVAAALKCTNRQKYYSNYGSSLACNLLSIRPWDSFGVLEAGIARPGMMNANAYLTRPDIVVVTSIKHEHIRSFKNLEEIRDEKSKIVSQLSANGVAVLNGDDEHVRWMADRTRAKIITYGFGSDNDIVIQSCDSDWPNGMNIRLAHRGQEYKLHTQMIGQHFAYALLAAIAVAVAVGLEINTVIRRLESLLPTQQRLEPIFLPNNVCILDDGYKGGVDSYRVAFESLKLTKGKRKIAVIGDIEDPPPEVRGDVYRELGVHIAQSSDIAVLVGGHDLRKAKSSAIRAGMAKDSLHYLKNEVHQVADLLRGMIQPGDVILVKGRGTQRFRRIVLALKNIDVHCPVKICNVKVQFCENCPMLDKQLNDFQNHYILPYVKF